MIPINGANIDGSCGAVAAGLRPAVGPEAQVVTDRPSTRPKLRHLVLFTFHAYGTWMPDRPQGYFKNRDGLREADEEEARRYRARQREAPAYFDTAAQDAMLSALRQSAETHDWTLVAFGTDDCHLHLIGGWGGDRTPDVLQAKIKTTLTYHLRDRVGVRRWFVRDGHNRRVRDRAHLDYLRDEYLPSHRGLCWDRRDDVANAPGTDCGP